MGKLIDGKWQVQSIVTSDDKGKYSRLPRTFRDTISGDHDTFKPEKNRYHLYVSYACPWAHRTLIYRHLKSLEDCISVDVVHPHLLENGWSFSSDFEGATGDRVNGKSFLYEIYQAADPTITTSVTVPILWDKYTKTIVNNESSEIIRLFNTAFNRLTGNTNNYYPESMKSEIDELNNYIYSSINNGVYRAGFAKNQDAYNEAIENLFPALEKLDKTLAKHPYLLGNKLTEADLRLIPTLLRFDLVYYIHFKTSKKKIADFTNLFRYTKELYELPAIKQTTHFEHIKAHYYYSHKALNPYQIVPDIEPNFG